jgi:hypothetical protein
MNSFGTPAFIGDGAPEPRPRGLFA